MYNLPKMLFTATIRDHMQPRIRTIEPVSGVLGSAPALHWLNPLTTQH